MPENNIIEIPLIRYISCFLSIACLVLVIVVLIKVNDKCKNSNENYDIEPSLNSNGDYSSSFSKGSVSDCNDALNNNSGVYYCDGQLIDPTADDSFCTGPASFIPDSENNYLGSCSKPINSSQNSGKVLCSPNTNYPIATNNCGKNPNFGMQGLPSDIAIIEDM